MAIPVAYPYLEPAILELLRQIRKDDWLPLMQHGFPGPEDPHYYFREWLDLTQPYKCTKGHGGYGDVYIVQGDNAWYIHRREIEHARMILEMSLV